jgi:hypothetical protein
MAIALQATVAPAGWLRGGSFDLAFIVGIAALALWLGSHRHGPAKPFRPRAVP